MAERLLLARSAATPALGTASAGTMALVGYPMDETAAAALSELGVDPTGHAGRRLTAGLVAEADLILCAEAMHRSVVLRLDPMAFRRTFTLREFGRLGAGLVRPTRLLEVDELTDRVYEVAARRGSVPVVDPGEDDIADPIGRPLPVHRECARQIAAAVDAVVDILGLAVPEAQAR